MNRVALLPPLRTIIEESGLRAQKKLGQNFLLDFNIIRKIARLAGPLEGYTIFEVGPGPGGLTRALLLGGASQVIAVEKDARCFKALESLVEAAEGRLRLIEGDALALDLTSLSPPPRKIVANLPYNIATPLLVGWLKRIRSFESLTLMFQKEVADRITASPGTSSYGRLSVLSHYLSIPKKLLDLSPKAFTPAPKVWSSVVQFIPREGALPIPTDALEKVTAAAFGQRRKMLSSSLKSFHPEIMSLLRNVHIDPSRRPETVSVEEFVMITKEILAQDPS